MNENFQVDKAERSATITRQRPAKRHPSNPLQGALPHSLWRHRSVTFSLAS